MGSQFSFPTANDSIAIIGLGYVGIPLLLEILKTSSKRKIIGFDIDKQKIKSISEAKTLEQVDDKIETSELNKILKDEIARLLTENNTTDLYSFEVPLVKGPYVILVVGVNGVGKTSTTGKLAAQFKALNKKVILGASDTFRAAAVDQLILWGEKVNVPVVSKGMNTDPAAVAYEAVKNAKEKGADVVIIDTAG